MEMKDGVLKGHYQLVYITPELLLESGMWRKMLTGDVYKKRLVAFVVDEAHTVKKWYIHTHTHIIYIYMSCKLLHNRCHYTCCNHHLKAHVNLLIPGQPFNQ